VTLMSYDIRGRRIEMIDPDMGRWTYGYNGIGELISQTDGRRAPDWTMTQQFDALGRPVLRSEVSPTLGTRTTTWAYDNDCAGGSLYAIGQTCSASVSGGAQTRYDYDAQARPFKTTVTIDGKPNTTYTLYPSTMHSAAFITLAIRRASRVTPTVSTATTTPTAISIPCPTCTGERCGRR
jgi:YD repeat-containing protein